MHMRMCFQCCEHNCKVWRTQGRAMLPEPVTVRRSHAQKSGEGTGMCQHQQVGLYFQVERLHMQLCELCGESYASQHHPTGGRCLLAHLSMKALLAVLTKKSRCSCFDEASRDRVPQMSFGVVCTADNSTADAKPQGGDDGNHKKKRRQKAEAQLSAGAPLLQVREPAEQSALHANGPAPGPNAADEPHEKKKLESLPNGVLLQAQQPVHDEERRRRDKGKNRHKHKHKHKL